MASITFLQPVGRHPARKTHRLIQSAAGERLETQGYGNAVDFTHHAFPVGDIEDLASILEAQAPLERFVVRGAVAPDAPPIIKRRMRGDQASILDTPSTLIAVDLDREPAPADLDRGDILAVGDYLRGRLPPPLQGVSCVVQLSASHGLDRFKPDLPLKARLWFIADAPLDGGQLRRWFRESNRSGQWAIMDEAVASANQPIYTAAPLFENMADPVPVRLALLLGDRDTADLRPPAAPERPAAPTGPGVRCPEVLRRAVRMIEDAADGQKHQELNRAAFLAGGYVGGGVCTEAEARAALQDAIGRKAGVRDLEAAYQTIDNALRDGMAAPLAVGADHASAHELEEPPPLGDKSDLEADLERLRAAPPAAAWPVAQAIIQRYVGRCPWKMGYTDLGDAVISHLPAEADHRALTGRIRRRLSWLEQERRRDARKATDLDPAALVEAGVVLVTATDIAAALVEAEAHPEAVVLVKGPIASGKTEHLLKPLALAAVDTVVALTHRRSLVADLCARLDLASYQDRADMGAVTALGVCVNSLPNPRLADPLGRAGVVLIDEIGAVVKECHNPAGTLGRHAGGTWKRLLALLRGARCAVGVDADLCTADVLALAAEVGRPVRVVWVRGTGAPLQVAIGDKRQVWQAILDAADAGEPLRVCADSAKEIRKLAALLGERHPEARLLAIHADGATATTGTPEVQAALADINNAVGGLDILLHSPAVESGVSLTIPRFVRTFGLYCGRIAPAAFVQMLRRDRTAQEIAVGIAGHGWQHLEDRPGSILAAMGASHARSVEIARDEGGYDLRIEPATPWDHRAACYKAARHGDLNRYAAHLFHLLESHGARVARMETAAAPAADLARATDLAAAAYCNTVAAAPEITADERAAFEVLHHPAPWQAAAMAKFDLRDTLQVEAELTADDFALWDEGRVGPKVRRFAVMTGAPLAAMAADRADAEERIPLAARRNRLALAEALRTAVEVLGFDPGTGRGEITAAAAAEAWGDLAASPVRATLEAKGLIRFQDAPPKYPVRWAQDFLDKLGLRLECLGQHRTEAGVVRSYGIAQEPTRDKTGRRITAPGWRLLSHMGAAPVTHGPEHINRGACVTPPACVTAEEVAS